MDIKFRRGGQVETIEKYTGYITIDGQHIELEEWPAKFGEVLDLTHMPVVALSGRTTWI